ncbi:cytochrome-c oxidase, cbb3-type subunit III [Pseudaminobacter sp. 19-2017]|uniref:Cbb3-type cytochrome c oxidase subunit n=1 Tax=Pseudaminobacter soli (ex Zhang et al. 2022) TaxID=2831468 RepID=A0A942DZN7_9HYPH|nr:cytochrome-c oxidase, cbb3-type subunit III [Pseudaminobacter soli]MBS3648070.1 cytochrome-c oxidase, cbb3-type subunit III [Pseudaminobacter soli]
MSEKQIDEVSGVSTTGHEWDGIKELDNPMPRWWLWTFYATVVWALAYAIAFPAWPLINSATTGLLGYSSRADVKNELAAVEAAKADYVAEIAAKSVEEILADENLRTFATAAGSATFKVNCVQCHGSGAEGGPGYPNLNDDEWLWGGDIESIRQSIAHGIRYSEDADTRVSEMPAFRDVLQPGEIQQVAAFAASLSGMNADAEMAAAGKPLFEQNCAACHGESGNGNREMGAPDLTDAIWLYGSSQAEIAAQIRSPKHGVMPAWGGRLGDVAVKELSVFVHSLGGGE